MGKRFDDLSKAFATGVSRRQALMGALGGVGAAVAAAVIPGKGALADDDSARKCASFCATWCGDPGYFTNGSYDPCTDQCIAQASMGQGACFTVNGAPLYTRGCHTTSPQYTSQCPPNMVCCNGRCCKPDLCVEAAPIYTNGLVTNGIIIIPGASKLKSNIVVNGHVDVICLGCPPSK